MSSDFLQLFRVKFGQRKTGRIGIGSALSAAMPFLASLLMTNWNSVMQVTLPNFPELLGSSVVDEVSLQFNCSGHLRLRTLRVEEDEGSVILTGQLPTYYLKQVAQSLAISVPGVEAVRNEVTVEAVR